MRKFGALLTALMLASATVPTLAQEGRGRTGISQGQVNQAKLIIQQGQRQGETIAEAVARAVAASPALAPAFVALAKQNPELAAAIGTGLGDAVKILAAAGLVRQARFVAAAAAEGTTALIVAFTDSAGSSPAQIASGASGADDGDSDQYADNRGQGRGNGDGGGNSSGSGGGGIGGGPNPSPH